MFLWGNHGQIWADSWADFGCRGLSKNFNCIFTFALSEEEHATIAVACRYTTNFLNAID